MDYSINGAEWTDHSWDNNEFTFALGNYTDTDGDEFYFLVIYKKEDDKYVFIMQYEDDTLIYGCGNAQVDDFFERHMSKEMMCTVKEYVAMLQKEDSDGYTVTGYDKDNDVYKWYGIYADISVAVDRAKELTKQMEQGMLKRKCSDGTEEPIDWVEVYWNWDKTDKQKKWTSYDDYKGE